MSYEVEDNEAAKSQKLETAAAAANYTTNQPDRSTELTEAAISEPELKPEPVKSKGNKNQRRKRKRSTAENPAAVALPPPPDDSLEVSK